MSWKDKAIKMLEDSLIPVPSELNALGFKDNCDTVEAGYIKQEDETVTSRKYVTYIPYYG